MHSDLLPTTCCVMVHSTACAQRVPGHMLLSTEHNCFQVFAHDMGPATAFRSRRDSHSGTDRVHVFPAALPRNIRHEWQAGQSLHGWLAILQVRSDCMFLLLYYEPRSACLQ